MSCTTASPLGRWIGSLRKRLFPILIVLAVSSGTPVSGYCRSKARPAEAAVTILCYMNGDNDLSQEVLHALDMMETVGSSDRVNVIALIDGHKGWLGPYRPQWNRTRLLRLEIDAQVGVINSEVIEEWGEDNLGSPAVLERFIRVGLDRYPARRYIFYTFAHGRGVIDTRCFSLEQAGKRLSISKDMTSQSQMAMSDFHGAIKRGLDGRRFDLMVLFSCLANMVEVGYALSDVTHTIVGSQDEIRLLNHPPGSYQIRGLRFEETIAVLRAEPLTSAPELGRQIVDSHVDSYERDTVFVTEMEEEQTCRFSGGMAVVDATALPALVGELDELARLLLAQADSPGVVDAMQGALAKTQRFASFLNMEYYDLANFIRNLRNGIGQPDLLEATAAVLKMIQDRVILYERHTQDCDSSGMSVYISNPLVPENIYAAHQALYGASAFARDTQWDEMIEVFRLKIRTMEGLAR
jgi:hypothetical protein